MDAYIKTNASRSKEADVKAKMQLPVGAAAGAAVGAPDMGTTALDVDVVDGSVSHQKQSTADIEVDITGLRVIVV